MTAAAQPVTLAEVLGRPMHGVARVVLEHHRREQFRWIVILELILLVFFMICLLPLILLVAIFSDSYVEMPSIGARFYDRWHEVRLILLDRSGQVLSSVGHVPGGEEAGHGVVQAILSAAQREQVVVIETIAGGVSETIEVWYGGRPLLAHPDEVNEEQAASVLERLGFVIRRENDALLIEDVVPPFKTWQRVLGAVLFIVLSPILIVALLTERGRKAVRESWDNVRGVPPGTHVIAVRAECIETFHLRKGERRDHDVIDGRELLGLTYSPTLGFDKDVTRRNSTLRIIGRRHTRTLRITRAGQSAHALRDLLVAATLRLRQARPELGLSGDGPHPTRCPFCSALYLMDPGTRCPSCGAHAGTTP